MAEDARPRYEFLGPPPSAAVALPSLAAPLRQWLEQQLGEPTPIQRLAWPAIANGRHLLISAPTGSGKTLAAFLPILSELITGPLTPGVRCLYVSPLKALANDVRKNLRRALSGLRERLPEGTGRIRVALRTGDTPERLRRRLRTDPPELLLTTPESLAVLLSQASAADLFGALRWVVVDEVHALAASKRGCDLVISLERLERLAGGELQRIGLSATCAPIAEAARFLVGENRPCAIAEVRDAAPLELRIEPLEPGVSFVAALADRLEPELRTHRSTLIFTSTRALAEKVSWRLRQQFPEWVDEIAVHHSSLAPARRRRVERALKQGRLRAVVTSTSLELGIDIGSVDVVVLVHPPGDVVRLLQRVGRSGHGPGRVRRGLVLTASPAELIEAAVAGTSGRRTQLEPLRIPEHPLDVLCQQLVGLGCEGRWSADEAWELVRRAAPYQGLAREEFDACLAYLHGRHPDGRDWLPPRLTGDGEQFRIVDERTARLLRRNLGTILAEEPRVVRLASGSAVGDVEEPFAERLQPGDRFLLDGRCLEYRRTEGQQLIVEEVFGRPAVPRWSAAGLGLSPELARRLYLLRVEAAEALRSGPEALTRLLREDYGLAEPAVQALAAYFEEQERLSEIPDIRTLLIEIVPRQGAADCYLHTPLNRAGNEALTCVAVRRLSRLGRATFSLVADLGLHISFAGAEPPPEAWRELLSAEAFDADLTEALRDGLALRERFARVAQTGLMLLRNPLGGRRPRVGGPAWGERRLFDLVRAADPEFVLLRQAERELLSQGYDGAAARHFAETLPRLTIRCRCLPRLSPFVEAWTQVAPGPMETTETPAEALQRLHASLVGPGGP